MNNAHAHRPAIVICSCSCTYHATQHRRHWLPSGRLSLVDLRKRRLRTALPVHLGSRQPKTGGEPRCAVREGVDLHCGGLRRRGRQPLRRRSTCRREPDTRSLGHGSYVRGGAAQQTPPRMALTEASATAHRPPTPARPVHGRVSRTPGLRREAPRTLGRRVLAAGDDLYNERSETTLTRRRGSPRTRVRGFVGQKERPLLPRKGTPVDDVVLGSRRRLSEQTSNATRLATVGG